MKVSVDGGALNQDTDHRFGTAVYSDSLVKALKLYDKNNRYYVYTFDNLKPKLFWLKGRVSLEEFRKKKDIFLALNQAIPFYASGKIIGISHGLSFKLHPEIYPKKHVARMNGQLNEMVKRSERIVVSSKKVRQEFLKFYPDIGPKLAVLPFGLPQDMSNGKNLKKKKYFLFVGNNQKIKNIDFVIDAFDKSRLYEKGFKLLLIGDWLDYQDRGRGIASVGNVSRNRLKKYYQQAAALVTASYYESFNFPVLEALSQGCPVIGLETAVIPELRPFSNIAINKGQFVAMMRNATAGGLDIAPAKKIKKLFSWKSYVKNLVRLYKQ